MIQLPRGLAIIPKMPLKAEDRPMENPRYFLNQLPRRMGVVTNTRKDEAIPWVTAARYHCHSWVKVPMRKLDRAKQSTAPDSRTRRFRFRIR